MTNEIAVERKKSSAVPTVLTAAVAGGIAARVTRPRYRTIEEISSEIKDVTDFSQKTEPEFWNAAKEKFSKVQELEKEFAEKVKANESNVSEEVKKTMQDAIAKAKEEYGEAAKKLSEKLGKSGDKKKRIIAICLSVLGGGILGKLLFGRKKNA